MKNRLTHSGGFTLLELLMVVIIIAILAAIALPQFLRAAEKTRAAEAFNILGAMRSSANNYLANSNLTPPSFPVSGNECQLDIDIPGCQDGAVVPLPATALWTYTLPVGATCLRGGGCQMTATRTGGILGTNGITLNLDTGFQCATGAAAAQAANVWGVNPPGPGC